MASSANISDTPPTKTRIRFNASDGGEDLKANIENLVGQLNREWKVMFERVDELEKFQSAFTSETLPVIHAATTGVAKLEAKIARIPEEIEQAVLGQVAHFHVQRGEPIRYPAHEDAHSLQHG